MIYKNEVFMYNEYRGVIMLTIVSDFIGYLLMTTGLYALYLIIFRKSRVPAIFSKLWMTILIVIFSIVLIIIGWIMVN